MPLNRRIFLSNLALLTAGTVLGRNYAGPFSSAPDLELLWKTVCTYYKAEPHNKPITQKEVLPPCKGHKHEEGTPVFFPAENMIAQPVWIYWDCNPGKPSDVIIHCYRTGNATSLNQFELKSIAAQNGRQPTLAHYLQHTIPGQRLSRTRILVNNRNTITTVHV